jgi:hypothetical protein
MKAPAPSRRLTAYERLVAGSKKAGRAASKPGCQQNSRGNDQRDSKSAGQQIRRTDSPWTPARVWFRRAAAETLGVRS